MKEPGHERWMREAIALSRQCPVSRTFSVGAVIVGVDGAVLSTGFSREGSPDNHAEEAALAKLAPDDPRLATATLYSSLEPCSTRASRPVSCTQHILRAGVDTVVFAWREPLLFADCDGAETLAAAGVRVVELSALADEVRAVNAHVLADPPA
ncbi:deaminase [Streptomyces xiamenensis]|uniref:deaminase n=1 Tax=Streptomyces xiamenensis TaxID=408015 RepID=UPI003449419D